MKIGIYQQAVQGETGGSELVVATMAQALRGAHSVAIVHHRPDLSIEHWESFFHLDLSGIDLRFSPPPDRRCFEFDCRLWRLPGELQRWNAEVSKPYDVFICSTHEVPPFCHAPKGILYVHFPFYDRRRSRPWTRHGKGLRAHLGGLARRPLYAYSWRKRFASYQTRLANSQFTADWTRHYWGIDCDVVFPPAPIEVEAQKKRDQIVAVGRFVPDKKQVDLIANFRNVHAQLPGWSFTCLGGLADDPCHLAYFRDVQETARSLPVCLLPNASRLEIQTAFARAKIFWHGKGLNVDERSRPLELEHFGIATVEAMAAGCVPVVINRGGQREIVQQGLSGFLCENLDEMAACTIRLARDEVLRSRMATAARARALAFSRDQFVERFLSRLKPLGV